jgi:hypothetical protein
MNTPQIEDRVIWRPDLQSTMHVSSETMRRWLRSGKLPKPDVAMSFKTMGWKLSTLRAAGINLV